MSRFNYLVNFSTLSASVFSAFYFFPRLFRLNEIRKEIQLKEKEVEIPVPKKLNDLINEVMNDMKLKNEEKSVIKPFMSTTYNLFHYGYAGTKAGAIFGIPKYFSFNNENEVTLNFLDTNVELNPESLALKKVFYLSEEAKKFAIAHEIYEVRHPSFYPTGLSPVIITVIVNCLLHIGEKGKHTRMKKIILALQAKIIIIGMFLYFFINDAATKAKEASADFEAADLGKNYIKGGIEYYEKLLERNKIIKHFCQAANYGEDGEIINSWPVNHLRFSRRLEYLKDIQNAAKTNKQKPSIWDYVNVNEILDQ